MAIEGITADYVTTVFGPIIAISGMIGLGMNAATIAGTIAGTIAVTIAVMIAVTIAASMMIDEAEMTEIGEMNAEKKVSTVSMTEIMDLAVM